MTTTTTILRAIAILRLPSLPTALPLFALPLSALLLATATPFATAQQPTTTPAATDTATDAATILDKVIIDEVDVDNTILSLRPSRSLYGFDELLRDTPRSVFQVSKAQLATDNIRNFSDLSRYSPSIRRGTTTTYGMAGLRGSQADTVRNGVVLINTALRPFNSNAWESVDIVAGLPSASQGSTSRTAGYVNYITKKPYFDGSHTTLTASIGRLGKEAATSYPQYTITLDHSLVLIPGKLAARVSLQRSEAEQYWDGSDADFKDIFASVTWKPTKKLTLDANLSHTASTGALPWGINRLDQTLIDTWQYRAGDYVPIVAHGEGAARTQYAFNQTLNNGLGGWYEKNRWDPAAFNWSTYTPGAWTPIAGANPNTAAYNLGSAPWEIWTDTDNNGIQDRANVGTLSWGEPADGLTRQPIKGNQVVAGRRGANNNAEQLILQNTTTYTATDWLTLINRTSYQYVKNINRNYDYMFSEHPNRVFETRLEIITDKEFKLFGKIPIRHQGNTGASYRYLLNICDSAVDTTHSDNLTTYANALNPQSLDLSYRLSSHILRLSADDLTNIHPTHVGGLDWTNTNLPFVDSADALKGILRSGYGYLWLEPSWTDGGTQRSLSIGGGQSLGLGAADYYSFYDRRANYLNFFNLFHEQKFDITKYVTLRGHLRYSYVYDTIRSTILTQRLLDNGYFDGSPYAGVPRKAHAEDHQWQYGWSLACHPFTWLNLYILSDHTEIIQGCGCCEADGWSFGGGYLLDPLHFKVPSRLREYGAKFDIIPGKLFASAAYYKQDRPQVYTFGGTPFWMNTLYKGYETAITYAPTPRLSLGANYSRIHAYDPTAAGGWTYARQIAGTAVHTTNLWASYQFRSGLGLKTSLWITSKWTVNSATHVPQQHNIDLGLFYAAKKWRADVDILNITDEKNWGPSNANGGDNLSYLLPLERLGLQAKITRHF
jgi:hypothetical protein